MVRFQALVSVLALALMVVAGCGDGGTVTQESPPSANCLRLAGERIDSITWGPGDAYLAVASFDESTAEGIIRRVTSSGLAGTELARGTAILSLAGITASDDGITWVETHEGAAQLATWNGQGISRVAVDGPLYSLHRSSNRFLGIDPRTPSVIAEVQLDGSLTVFLDAGVGLDSFDVNRDGKRLVFQPSNVEGGSAGFTLVIDGSRSEKVSPPGRLLLNPKLDKSDGTILYENHDVAALMRVDPASGDTDIVLSEDVSEAAVATDGQIAHTFATPEDADWLCLAPGR